MKQLIVKFAVCAAALSAISAQAATPLIPEQFATIQSALSVAVDGDQVSVAPGTYRERIDLLGKRVVVASRQGAAATLIDGTGLGGYVVRAALGEPAGAAIVGFTVKGGVGTSQVAGGGLLVSSSVEVSRCVLVGNTDVSGAAAQVASGSPRFISCVFRGNQSSVFGAVYDESLGPRYEDCTFAENYTSYGGGLAAVGRTVVLNCRFIRNGSGSFGGGLFLSGGREGHVVDGCFFLDNGSAERSSNNVVTYFTFAGGGLYTQQATARISRSRFTEGQALKGGGGFVAGQGRVVIVNCISDRNESNLGGGICLNASNPLIVNTTVVNNLGGIYTTVDSAPTVVNTISAFNAQGIVRSLDVYGSGRAQVAFSVVSDPILNGFINLDRVIVADPRLLDDFRLRPGSPSIDAGDSTAVSAGVTTDFFGAPRFLDDPNTANTGIGTPPVDIGASEFHPRPVFKSHIAN